MNNDLIKLLAMRCAAAEKYISLSPPVLGMMGKQKKAYDKWQEYVKLSEALAEKKKSIS